MSKMLFLKILTASLFMGIGWSMQGSSEELKHLGSYKHEILRVYYVPLNEFHKKDFLIRFGFKENNVFQTTTLSRSDYDLLRDFFERRTLGSLEGVKFESEEHSFAKALEKIKKEAIKLAESQATRKEQPKMVRVKIEESEPCRPQICSTSEPSSSDFAETSAVAQ